MSFVGNTQDNNDLEKRISRKVTIQITRNLQINKDTECNSREGSVQNTGNTHDNENLQANSKEGSQPYLHSHWPL